MSRFKEVFFDCDGTLVDSEVIAMRVAGEVLLEALQAKDHTISFDLDEFVQKYAGWHFDNMIIAAEKQYAVELDHDAVSATKTIETLKALEDCLAIDGMNESIIMLGHRSIAYSLVTSSELDRVGISLEAAELDVHFQHERRYSAHDSLPEPKHKPAPDVYELALEDRNRQAHEVVAIEDSGSGVKSAIAAGIETIGFVGATHIPTDKKDAKAKELMEAGASVVIGDMGDLPYVLDHYDDPQMLLTILGHKQIWFSEDYLAPLGQDKVASNSGPNFTP